MSGGIPSLGPSGHIDDFTRRNLPPIDQWPELLLDRPEFQYPEYLNVAVELTDRIVEKGFGDRIALIGNGRQRTYKELADWSNRLAHALVENYGVKPDIFVENSPEDNLAGRDRQIETAVQELLKEIGSKAQQARKE